MSVQQFHFLDDFFWYISPHFWTSLAADAGITAPAQSDADKGIVTGATGPTDNNEIAVRSTNALFLFAADRTFYSEWRIQWTEAATNAANIAVGWADAAGADLLLDNGGGQGIANSGVLIYKVDGETVWRAAAKNGATVRTSQSGQTAGGTAYQRLAIEGRPVDGTNYEMTYFLDGLALTDINTNRPIKHTLPYASPTVMRFVGIYAKAGSANSQTVNIDYAGFGVHRT